MERYIYLIVIFLAACSTNKFDSLEYNSFISLQTIVMVDEGCNNLKAIKNQLIYTKNYNQFNKDNIEILEKIENMIDRLLIMENPNHKYCQEKRENIVIASKRAAKAMLSKER